MSVTSTRTSFARTLWSLAAVILVFAVARPAEAHRLDDYRRERAHVESRARSVIGAPYSYGGTSPSGFDCSGFTRWVFSGHGAELPHSSMEQFNLGSRAGHQRIWDRRDLEVGDLVFHKTTGARVGHVGVYIGKDRFISATSSGGVQIRSLYDPYYWGPRWVGGTRLPATSTDRSDHERDADDDRAAPDIQLRGIL